MLRLRRRLAVLGLCAGALGTVVFGGSAVQAEKNANWKVNGVNVTTLSPIVQVKEVENKQMSLLFTTKGGTKTTFACTGAEFIGAKLEAEGKVSENKIQFSGCTTTLNGAPSAQCQPRTGAKLGVVTTNAVVGLLVLHELVGGAKDTLIRFQPTAGETLINFELGEECSIGETCPILGKLMLLDTSIGTEQVDHLVREGPLTSLTALGQPGSIDGSAILHLVGAGHEGLKWSGTAA
jgi:hypothetical protein